MEEGTIVHVDYELYNGETGELIETTREAVAKEHEMHSEGRSYTPMVCVVGAGNLIPGFEAALGDAKANKEIEVSIEPAEAYGEKDPTQIETISIDKLIRSVKDPTHCTSAHRSTLAGAKATCPISPLAVHVSITTTRWLARP